MRRRGLHALSTTEEGSGKKPSAPNTVVCSDLRVDTAIMDPTTAARAVRDACADRDHPVDGHRRDSYDSERHGRIVLRFAQARARRRRALATRAEAGAAVFDWLGACQPF